VAERVSRFVTAYSSDLRDESLDGQRVVVGGIVTGVRTVITKAKASMAIVTMEDLQGTIEVVVFPRLYEQTIGTWRDGEILLVAGRVDHKGEEVSLLADMAVDWDEAAAAGEEAFARQVTAGDRGRGRGGTVGNGSGNGNGGTGRPLVAVGPGVATAVAVAAGGGPIPQFVSPLRHADPAGGAALPSIAPAEPMPTYEEPSGAAAADPDVADEPALPDEARARAADLAAAPTPPLDPGAGRVLHVRFFGGSAERLLDAMRAFREVIRTRPGETRVFVHIDVAGGSGLPMELKPVAYDAELLADVQRRLGEGIVELRLA
jgi:hypothetical protein